MCVYLLFLTTKNQLCIDVEETKYKYLTFKLTHKTVPDKTVPDKTVPIREIIPDKTVPDNIFPTKHKFRHMHTN